MEQWEYYVANVELKEVEGKYDWVSAIGKETIVGLSPLLKRFGLAGWELVSLLPLRQTTIAEGPHVTQVEIITAAFKRRLVAPGEATAPNRRAPAGQAATDNDEGGAHEPTEPASEQEP